MTDLSDINMEGVKPMSDAQELGAGQYLVRIEDTDKKQVQKEVYDEAGNKLVPNHYLQIDLKVYGGPDDGRTEFVRLNLWNHNVTAVNMAKSELKSIQEATQTVSTNSEHLHGKWMILEKKAGVKDPTKLYKHYSAAPAEIVASFAGTAAPIAAKAPAAPAFVRNMPGAAALAAATAPAAGALPSWAMKK